MGTEGRATSRVEAAFWDRLLRLPPSFLERYTASELAMRGMTFQSLRDAVQGAVANTVLSVVFLSPALILIVVYDAVLGGVAAAFGLLSVMLTIGIGLRQAVPRGRVLQTVHYLAGRLFEVINGIAELRVAGAEGSAFGVWARKYRDQKHAELQLGRIEQHLHGFRAALPFLTGAVLLLAAVLPGREPPTAGSFLAAVAAFMVFQTAVGRLGDSFGAIAAIVPSLRQVQPFLAEPPETSAGGEPVESVGGEVVLDRVSFRYDSDGPLILDDVSIRVNPGEFVAIACNEEAMLLSIASIPSAYGRAASAASCARRSFAAATICMARVILRVDTTLLIRVRSAFRVAIGTLPLLHQSCRNQEGPVSRKIPRRREEHP